MMDITENSLRKKKKSIFTEGIAKFHKQFQRNGKKHIELKVKVWKNWNSIFL